MGIYVDPKSPYYWMYLEVPNGRGPRLSTMIPREAHSPQLRKRNRRLAEDLYTARMGELARDRLLATRETVTVTPFTHKVPPPPPLNEHDWCYVYFIQRAQRVKIGRTTNVQKRLEALRTASDEPIRLLAAVLAHASLETALQKLFEQSRSAGEWFVLGDEILTYIAEVNSGKNPVAVLYAMSGNGHPSEG